MGELYADANQIAPDFEKMCEEAAAQPGCFASFGPQDRHTIKERSSLQDKINQDKKLLLTPQQPEPASQLPSATKDAYSELLIRLLENPSVKGEPSLVAILESQFESLSHQKTQTLTPKQEESYWLAQRLLVDQKVAQIVSRSLHKIHASKPPESKEAFPTSQLSAVPLQVVPVTPVVPSMAFGAAEWRKYFGDVGAEPPLPPNIEQILSRPCPFTPPLGRSQWSPFGSGKTIRDTHLLVLVPQTVNGRPLTLQLLGELVQKPLQGHASKYGCFLLGKYTDPPASRSRWALVTRDVVEGSRNKSYKDQQAVLASYSQNTGMPYVVPRVLDATTAIFMEHARSGIKLYGKSPYTLARCQEKYDANGQLVVGGFSASGLHVSHDFYASENVGVGGSLEVFGDG